MTFRELLVQFLTTDSVLEPLVGTRVYDTYMPELTPDQLYPCLTYTVISRGHVRTLQGNAGLYKPQIQIIAWSLKSSDIATITDRLQYLEGKQTLAADGGLPALQWLFVEDETDDAAQTEQMDDRAVRYATTDIVLWYRG